MTPENHQVWVFATSTVLPAIIALINRPHWNSTTKACVSLLCIVVTSFFWVWFNDQWDAVHIADTLKTVILTTVAIYQIVFKPLGWKDSLEQSVNSGAATTDEPTGSNHD